MSSAPIGIETLGARVGYTPTETDLSVFKLRLNVVTIGCLLSLALLGHATLWINLENHLHALPLPRKLIKLVTLVMHGLLVFIPIGLGWWLLREQVAWYQPASWRQAPGGTLVLAYLLLAVAVALGTAPWWLVRKFSSRPPAILKSDRGTIHDLGARLPPQSASAGLGRLATKLPGNQSLHLEVSQKELELADLPAELDGLTIVHLSDLHYSARIGRAWFDEVMLAVGDLQPDLIALTGDIVDKANCLNWVPATLGRLEAPLGKFFVLGNHDMKVDHRQLRQIMADAGFTDMAGSARSVAYRGTPLLLAGNERPWFNSAPEPHHLDDAAPSDAFRLLLAHTPDQIGWARRHQFHLMLAGHTHGGQIRLPWIGPILAPSHYGVRYASGTFHLPPTVMHVSRGISGLQPLRWNCPPELAKLTLRPAATRRETAVAATLTATWQMS